MARTPALVVRLAILCGSLVVVSVPSLVDAFSSSGFDPEPAATEARSVASTTDASPVGRRPRLAGPPVRTMSHRDAEALLPGAPVFARLVASPTISATKVDALSTDVNGNGQANPGDTLMYTVVISNTGTGPATGVMFSDTIDANTTLVPGSAAASPLAIDDSYNTIGNVHIQVPVAQGVIGNDINPNGAGTLTVTGVNATVVPGGGSATAATTNGSVTMSSDGSFTYTPNAGFRGPSDSFTYTLSNGTGKTDTATVTVTVSGLIWFVNSAAATNGDGRLSSPFKNLTGTGFFDPAAADAANDNIFLYGGTYTGGLTLLAGQKLISQGATSTLLSITGLAAPSGTNLLPSTGGPGFGFPAAMITTSAASTAGVTLGSGNQIWGIIFSDTTGFGITGANVGALKIRDTQISNAIGPAISLTGSGTLDAIFAGIFSQISSTATPPINFDTIGGSLTVTGSTANFQPSGIGFRVQNMPAGGSFNFGETLANGGAGTAMVLTSNAGAVSFGTLSMSANGGQRGLLAQENSGQITCTSGMININMATAVEITKTTGTTPLAMVLTSVGTQNAPNGIVLSNTSGSFTVNGDGTNTSVGGNGSGGTLANMSGADGATTGIGVYLNNASNVTLRRMTINGTNQNFALRGLLVNGFTLEYSTIGGTNGTNAALDEAAVAFGTFGVTNGLTGSATIRRCNISGGIEDNFRIKNLSGTLNRVVFDDNTFGANSTALGNDSLGIEASGTAVINITATANRFTAAAGDLFGFSNIGSATCDIIFTGNTLSNNHPAIATGGGGMTIGGGDGNGSLTYNISSNTFRDSDGHAVLITKSTGSGTYSGTFDSNTIGVAATANSGSLAGSDLKVQSAGGGTVSISITNNQFRWYNNFGIELLTGGSASAQSGIFNAKITGNTIANPGNNPGTAGVAKNGIHLNGGTVPGDTYQICLGIGGSGPLANSITGSGAPNDMGAGGEDFRLRQRQSTTVRLPGYGGGSTDTAAVVAFVKSNNGTTPTGTASTAAGGGFVGGAACATPRPANRGESSQSARSSDDGTLVDGEGDSSLYVPFERVEDDGSAATLSQAELDWIAQAAIERWRETGIFYEDMTRLHSLKFAVSDLPGTELARVDTNGIQIDRNAAGYGWYFDGTPDDDAEFVLGVPKRELQATETSDAHEKLDLLTVVMRELGQEYVQGKKRVPKKLRPLLEATLAPGVRRLPDASSIEVRVPKHIEFESVTERTAPIVNTASVGGTAPATPGATPGGGTAPQSGETVAFGPFTLPAGKSVTIMFRATIDVSIPTGVCQVSNQGTVSGSNFSNVLTDDSDVVGVNQPTQTMIFRQPVIGACPANISTGTAAGQCSAVVTYTTPTATGCPTPTVTCVPASGATFALGTTTVTCTATNAALPSTPSVCTFTVTVVDNQPPSVTCPANISVNAGAGQCSAVVTYTTPTATDNCPGTPTVNCSPASGTTFQRGVTTVTCTASDGTNTTNCTFTVTVVDNQPPTVTCPANISTNTAAGQCSAVVTYTTPTATDNCMGATVVCAPASGSTFARGVTTVTCTATDVAGLTGTCTFTVTVVDNQAPSMTCPANITTNTAAGQCSAVVTYTTPTATDNCPSPTVNCVPASGMTFVRGVTTVTCTASDGTNTTNCTFTVTVVDNQPPTVTCPANISTNTGAGQCSAVVTYTTPTATDNCMGATVVCAPASGSTFTRGVTTVTCTATDVAGLTGMCTFTVTVVDNQAPSVTCPANITTNTAAGQCSAVVTYTTPTATDNCPSPTVNCSPASGATFVRGVTTVTCTASDGTNTTNCTFTVTVNDNQPPTLTCPANITTNAGAGQCSAVVNYTTPTATDNCMGTTVTCTPASGSTFTVGATSVTCTATDVMGLTASCTFSVTVVDNQPPTLVCPANISTNAGAGQCSAAVTYTTPTATDNCPGVGATTCVPSSGSTFAVGTTTVTCSAVDASSNTGQCTFTVTVVDNQPPTLTCPANITTNTAAGQCSAVVTYTTPSATDNCPGATVTCTPASGSTFALGTTTVTCTASDVAAQTAQCTFTVTVVDNQPPTVTCPANITVVENPPSSGMAVVTYTTPSASDNCPGATVNCTPASGSTFTLGVTTVTCTATDGSSNTGQCTFTVTVQPACMITCPANIATTTDAGQCGAVVKFAPTTTGNCGTVTCVPAAGSMFAVGTTTVTCTTMVGPSCSFTVTVADNQPPTLTCPASVTANAGAGQCSAVVNYTTSVTDNCMGATMVCTPASGSTFGVGTTTVSCTAMDAAGNSAACSFVVTVVDTQAPQIVCPANITTTGTLSGCVATAVVTYANPTVTDNCPGATFTCVPASGSTFNEGVTTVTCTATDASGNTSSCTFTVTVGATFGFCAIDDTTGDRFQMDVNPTSPTYRRWRYTFAATNTTICGTANYLAYVPGIKLRAYDNDYSAENPNYFMDASFGTTSGTVTIRRPGGTTVAFLRDRNLLNNPVCN